MRENGFLSHKPNHHSLSPPHPRPPPPPPRPAVSRRRRLLRDQHQRQTIRPESSRPVAGLDRPARACQKQHQLHARKQCVRRGVVAAEQRDSAGPYILLQEALPECAHGQEQLRGVPEQVPVRVPLLQRELHQRRLRSNALRKVQDGLPSGGPVRVRELRVRLINESESCLRNSRFEKQKKERKRKKETVML